LIKILYALKKKMSCNGCRILRKGCNENCILRQSLQGIESPQAQANAAVFVAKFFGRAGLMSFLSSVPESQRPAMFESLLYEACGRTVNPVNGAVGLLWTGNWHVCQAAVETVFQGGVVVPIVQFPNRAQPALEETDDCDHLASNLHLSMPGNLQQQPDQHQASNVMSRFPARMTARGREKRRAVTPEDSGTTTSESCLEYNNNRENPSAGGGGHERPVLRLFL
jgi:hypothetical protein